VSACDDTTQTIAGLGPATPIAGAHRLMSALFRGAGLSTPELDARLLLCHAAGLERRDLIVSPDLGLGHAAAAVAAAACRRLRREPVARILGHWEFWGLDFDLNAATLVPRPDTETLVEAVLADVRLAGLGRAPLRVLDLGTGSGAILVALLWELKEAFGVGVDRSGAAAVAARNNARRNGVADRAVFMVGEWGEALSRPFDLVVSNPPYIRHDDLSTLEWEVVRHDPVLALDGGVDGLGAYRSIISGLRRLLSPQGRVFLEVGAGQAEAVLSLLAADGMGPGYVRADLAGHARVVVAPAPPAETAQIVPVYGETRKHLA
jgi:release factor glutamine methyltransferase